MRQLSLHHLDDVVLVFELVSFVLQGEGSLFAAVQQQCAEVNVVHRENLVPAEEIRSNARIRLNCDLFL